MELLPLLSHPGMGGMAFLKTERNPERNEIHSGAPERNGMGKLTILPWSPICLLFPKPTFTERKPERNEKNDRNSGKNGIGTAFRPYLVPPLYLQPSYFLKKLNE